MSDHKKVTTLRKRIRSRTETIQGMMVDVDDLLDELEGVALEVDEARRNLIIDRDIAWDQAREACQQNQKHAVLVERTLAWCRAIQTLKDARHKGAKHVLEANRAYTEAHVALQAEAQRHLNS